MFAVILQKEVSGHETGFWTARTKRACWTQIAGTHARERASLAMMGWPVRTVCAAKVTLGPEQHSDSNRARRTTYRHQPG